MHNSKIFCYNAYKKGAPNHNKIMPKKSLLLIISAISILLAILLAPAVFKKPPEPVKAPPPPAVENNYRPVSHKPQPKRNETPSAKTSKILNLSHLPKIVHHNFIELDKISKISKFRSGAGHDFSRGAGENESCRSMKHYFEPTGISDGLWSDFHSGKTKKSDWPAVKYFAPVSGTIIDIRSAKNIFGDEEKQFLLESEEYPDILFGFFHVIVPKNLRRGSKVKAGEFLGTISPGNSGEIAVSANSNSGEQLISFFKLIDDNVFSEYKKRGVDSINRMIITKQERDKNPLICAKEMPRRFIGNSKISNKEQYDSWSMGPDNWVFLR